MTTLSDNPYALPVYDDWSAEQSAKREADYAAQLASFTDEQIARNIRELEQGEKDHAYTLMRSRDQARRDREFLWRYRREQERRAGDTTVTLNTVADLVCAAVCASTSLDAVQEAGLRSVPAVAAE